MATHAYTPSTPPDVTPTPHGPQDTLILAMNRAMLHAHAGWMAFDHVSPSGGEQPISTYIDSAGTSHIHRELTIRNAILAVQADGVAGALVQMQVVLGLLESGPSSDDHHDALLETGAWSVFLVLAKQAGYPASDVWDMTAPYRNPFRTDVAERIAEWRAMLTGDTAPVVPSLEAVA